ncbi:hypothetical protein FS837_004813 [Tulasnella sp. UAMH 9824]|nr:hypothetical protein FS837_004813 [Tulasnella sp. UAMH 9824]
MLLQARSLRFAAIVVSLVSIGILLDLSRSEGYIASRVQSHPLFSSYFPPDQVSVALDGSWKEDFRTVDDFNKVFEQELEDCRSGSGPCKTNQDKVVLLAWAHFRNVLAGHMQGENVWCDAMMDAMHALGYTLLLVQDRPHLYELWRRHYGSVQLIIWEDTDWGAKPCLRNSTCVYAPNTLDLPVPPPNSTHLNIPIWKVFIANWWNGSSPPLGGPFTLSPEPYNRWPKGNSGGKDNFYTGYSLERTCLKTPFTPHAERPRQAYVFAKFLKFFVMPGYILEDPQGVAGYQLNDDFYANLGKTDNITWLGQFKLEGMPKEPAPHPPPGITQVERMERPAFQRLVGQSRVLLGIGRPGLSPTPYEALCLGVPFINPIKRWDPKDPENRDKWEAQHDGLVFTGVDEPYVYHVKIGDRDGVARAVRKAMETPIERFIPPHMKMSALIDRMKVLLETDWRPVAQVQMETIKYFLDG